MPIRASSERPIVVVGAGVVGLSTAYYLRRAGADVVVVERRHPGAGASYGNAGWVTPSLSFPLPDPAVLGIAIRSLTDRDSPLHVKPTEAIRLIPWLTKFLRYCNARDMQAGLAATLRLAEPTMQRYDELAAEGVRFEMAERGVTFLALSVAKAQGMLDSLAPLREFGYHVPEAIDSAEALLTRDPGLAPAVHAGFHLAGERSVRPMTVVDGLTERLRAMDVEVRHDDALRDLVASGGSVQTLRTDRGEISPAALVIAAGAWSGALVRKLRLRLPVIAGKGYSAMVRPRVVPQTPLYLIEAKIGITPYGDEMRIAGTMELSGHNETFHQRRLDAVLRSASRYVADWKPDSVTDQWVGMRPVTPDGLPVLGPAPGWDNVFFNTGHAMQGVTLGPASGALVAESMLSGKVPHVMRPFLVDRFQR